jgi:hypothetical protein
MSVFSRQLRGMKRHSNAAAGTGSQMQAHVVMCSPQRLQPVLRQACSCQAYTTKNCDLMFLCTVWLQPKNFGAQHSEPTGKSLTMPGRPHMHHCHISL